MKNRIRTITGVSLALAFSLAARAQAPAGAPPNILSVEVDDIKAYQTAPYDKVAAEYPAVSEQFKQTTHYIAMEAMSGPPRAAYLAGYDSFEALQKDTETTYANTAMRARFGALDAREAPYVSALRNTIWHYRADLSNNAAGADLPHSHFWQIYVVRVRGGHNQAVEELAKLIRETDVKIGQNIPVAWFEAEAGATDTYLILLPMTSLKDRDTDLARDKDFAAALGEEGGRRLNHLVEEGVASVENDVWMVVPAASYVEKSWVEADPKYWGRKAAAKPAPKPTASATPAPKSQTSQ